jgi:hypothetical protein
MRPVWSAVVVTIVLLTAAFLLVIPGSDRGLTGPTATASGLKVDVAPTYVIDLGFSTQPVLPGYHDNLTWEILNDTNDAPFVGLTNITIRGTYYNTADKLLPLPGTPINITPIVAIGSFTFTVPANTSTNQADPPALTLWANSTSLKMTNVMADDLEVGVLTLVGERVCTVTDTCGALTTGEPATVYVTSEAVATFGATAPVAGETAKFLFFSTGSSPVTVPGVPASVTTNAEGNAAVTFTPLNTIFNVPGPDHIEIEVTDAVNASLTKYDNVTFDLYNPVGTTNYLFSLSSNTYYSGEKVVASWQWAGTNTTVGTLNVTNYIVRDDDTGNVIASGPVGVTTASGSFSFTLPSNYFGAFTVYAYAHNSSESWEWTASADAQQAIFGIIPSEEYYNPGDSITVTVISEGPAVSGATISAYVQATNSGQTLFNGTVSGLSFQFTIPKVAPALHYDIAAWASTPTAGTVASTDEEISESSEYGFWAAITTPSSYADGSFAPGQVVQIGFKVVAYGTAILPEYQEVSVFPGSCTVVCATETPALKSWFVTGSSGSVSFTIPSGTPNGQQNFIVVSEWVGGDGASQIGVNVNSSPSPLNYELGAGSGLTVGWLILLILLIVVVLVVLMTRRRGGPSRMVMTPAASSGAAPEWKEPQPQPTPPTTPPSGETGGTSGGGSSSSPPASQ